MDSTENHIKSPYRLALNKFSIKLLQNSKNLATLEENQKSTMTRQAFVLGGGLLLIIFGLFITFTWETILESQVNKEFILSEKSKTYVAWKKTRVDVYLQFYFWNWTNPEELRNPDFKPVLEETGPYAYREITEKVQVVWNPNGTVSYKRQRKWYFDPDRSNGTEDDMITSLDIVAQSSAFMTRYNNMWIHLGLDAAMTTSGTTVQTTKSVRELLFVGYKHSLITTAKAGSWLTQTKVPYDRFGWFYQRNGSSESDGAFNIETGINGMENFGKVRSWNHNNHTPYFADDCGSVRGSGGDFWPPKRTMQDNIELFSPDLCRYVSFKFTREEVIHGMTAYRYETQSALLDNGEADDANSCFCVGECAPPGVLNVSSCRFGAPAFVSYPHFYLADPYYRNSVIGMKPDPDRHGAHITLEPTYGIPLDVAARFQINILVHPYEHLTLFKGLKPIYFPVMWFEQTAYIPESTVKAVKMLLLLPTIGMAVAAILLVFGTALVITVISLRYCKTKKQLKISDDATGVIEPMLNGEANDKQNETIRWDTKF